MKALRFLPFLLLLPILTAPAQEKPAEAKKDSPFVHVARVEHHPIDEMSGIVKSRTYEDVYWVHNDSGDEPRLFAIDGKGKPVVPPFMAKDHYVGPKKKGVTYFPGLKLLLTANIDWEDITLADGHLYILEMGNNFNQRRDLGVYVLPEPNPRQTERMRTLRFMPIRYPDQDAYPPARWHFDCESIFHSDGKLYFLTKQRRSGHNEGERGTKLYRLDTAHTDRQNVLKLVDSHPLPAMPTGADLSPDGKRLAIVTVLGLWVFEKPATGDRWLSGKARGLPLPRQQLKQAEAVCWDDDETIRIANEQRDIFRVAVSALKPLPPKSAKPAGEGEEKK